MKLLARKKKLWISLSVILTAVIALTAVCALYLGDYYRADAEALEAFAPTAPVVSEEWKDGTLITRPEGRDPVAGLIFYPGGKVEHTAYTPLMEVIYACAKARGYTVAELESVRAEKAAKRGGFDRKILLKTVTED